MRVPTISTYVNSTYRLGKLTSDLENANEIAATQKRINEISDDPLGLTRVLSLTNTLGNLDQISQNVTMGKSWIESVETALDGVNDLILEVKTEVTRLANDSMTADERSDAVERVESIIQQIVALGNTQVNGNYIFSGTDTDILPLEYDTDSGQVIYQGNDTPFEIRTDKSLGVAVGRSGKDTFWDEEIQINSTNNTIVFKEDNGHGDAFEKTLQAVIPDGLYKKEELETAVRNALNDVSAKQGYGVTYVVEYDDESQKYQIQEDGSYDGYMRTEFLWETGNDAYIHDIQASVGIESEDIQVSVLNKSALTIGTETGENGPEPLKVTWNKADEKWVVTNNPGYVMPSEFSGTSGGVDIALNDSGISDISIKFDTPVQDGAYIEFEIEPAKEDAGTGHEIGFNGADLIYAPPVSDTQASYISELTIQTSGNNTIDFVEINSTGGIQTLTANINPTTAEVRYTDMNALAGAIELAMETASASGTNRIDYAVSYDPENSRFNIREDGSSLNELTIQWSSSTAAADTLGYYPMDDVITYPHSSITSVFSVDIDSSNNMIDFEEINTAGVPTTLQAQIPAGTYSSIHEMENALETAMNTASIQTGNGVVYDVSYDETGHNFDIQTAGGTALTELRLLWTGENQGQSIGDTLGYDTSVDDIGGTSYSSSSAPIWISFDTTNNVIDFTETSIDNTVSEEVSITIPPGDYRDLNQVALEIQTAMRSQSPNGIEYNVVYDSTNGFMIKGGGSKIKGFDLLWETGSNSDNSAARKLGITGDEDIHVSFAESDEEIVNIVIDDTNNKLDFMEISEDGLGDTAGKLTALIEKKTYTSHSELAREVEKAMESQSREKGNSIDYSVSWDSDTKKISIKENGTGLQELHLMWQTGDNAPLAQGGTGESIGSILGFDGDEDDIEKPLESGTVEWGIFDTLIDLKQYLSNNDRDGIERTIGRLETHYDNISSRIVDAGMKFSRLEVREKITATVSLSLTERRSTIEDADMIKSIMDLKNIETAYQAALSSTSKVLSLSLVDYLT